jgi:hypothetical protein
MSNLQAELFVRKQIQKILLENEESKELAPVGNGKVFGSAGRGRLPKDIAALFAGEDGSATEVKRLASSNPAKLMKNLRVTRGLGETTLERAKSLIENARSGPEVFGASIGKPQDMDNSKRKGLYFANAGLPSARLANLFIFDTLRAAASVGYIQMSGHLRVEEWKEGVLIYNVRNEGERWE